MRSVIRAGRGAAMLALAGLIQAHVCLAQQSSTSLALLSTETTTASSAEDTASLAEESMTAPESTSTDSFMTVPTPADTPLSSPLSSRLPTLTQNDTDASPTATAGLFDSDEFGEISGTNGDESASYDPPPPTMEQHEAENHANTPTAPIPPEDARQITVLESTMFEYFVQHDPAPVDAGQITIPDSVSSCNISLSASQN